MDKKGLNKVKNIYPDCRVSILQAEIGFGLDLAF